LIGCSAPHRVSSLITSNLRGLSLYILFIVMLDLSHNTAIVTSLDILLQDIKVAPEKVMEGNAANEGGQRLVCFDKLFLT